MLQQITLFNFRNYKKEKFTFDKHITFIIGQNTTGKTNLAEAIIFLATGKSFKADKENEAIKFSEEIARVQGVIVNSNEKLNLEVMLACGNVTVGRFLKKYQINNVPKSRNKFVGNLPTVIFRPEDLAVIAGGPSVRREFLDNVLEQVDLEYRNAKAIYDKSIRQRNALLHLFRETGKKNLEQIRYWDDLVIKNGQIITYKREEFIEFINSQQKEFYDLSVFYDKSIISQERILQYADAEIAAGITLVGPQRDNFVVNAKFENIEQNIELFGSRGQQRLAVLQLKILQLLYMQKRMNIMPLLFLDDIFSELDSNHIKLILKSIKDGQIVLTTTHEEFVKDFIQNASVIKLNKEG